MVILENSLARPQELLHVVEIEDRLSFYRVELENVGLDISKSVSSQLLVNEVVFEDRNAPRLAFHVEDGLAVDFEQIK